MARTKQTARKSVAAKMPRKHFYITHRVARKSAPINVSTGVKKVRLFKPGNAALKEIRKYQRNVTLFYFEETTFLDCFSYFYYSDKSFD